MSLSGSIRYLAAPVSAVVAYFMAPAVDSAPAGLATFFATSAQILASFLIALALLSSLPPEAHLRFRENAGGISLVYLGLGIASAAAGTLGGWPDGVYRLLFAITAGSALGTMAALVLFGLKNIKTAARNDSRDAGRTLGS